MPEHKEGSRPTVAIGLCLVLPSKPLSEVQSDERSEGLNLDIGVSAIPCTSQCLRCGHSLLKKQELFSRPLLKKQRQELYEGGEDDMKVMGNVTAVVASN